MCGSGAVDLTVQQFLWLSLMALLVGVGKAGFSGLSLIPVSVFAVYFGKDSVGVLLPLLIIADLIVYPVMRKHGSWKEVLPLLPPALIGIALGFTVLAAITDEQARPLIGSAILLMLLLISLKKLAPTFFQKLTSGKGFSYFSAILGGVATAVANAAGPIIKIFLLSKGFPKMELVGISARFFLVINLVKLPLMGAASLITFDSLLLNLKLAGFVVGGVFLGKALLKFVPQKVFDWLVICFALIAAVRLFL